jgi:hypothetical protein
LAISRADRDDSASLYLGNSIFWCLKFNHNARNETQSTRKEKMSSSNTHVRLDVMMMSSSTAFCWTHSTSFEWGAQLTRFQNCLNFNGSTRFERMNFVQQSNCMLVCDVCSISDWRLNMRAVCDVVQVECCSAWIECKGKKRWEEKESNNIMKMWDGQERKKKWQTKLQFRNSFLLSQIHSICLSAKCIKFLFRTSSFHSSYEALNVSDNVVCWDSNVWCLLTFESFLRFDLIWLGFDFFLFVSMLILIQ